jgi:hypothetical protein
MDSIYLSYKQSKNDITVDATFYQAFEEKVSTGRILDILEHWIEEIDNMDKDGNFDRVK